MRDNEEVNKMDMKKMLADSRFGIEIFNKIGD